MSDVDPKLAKEIVDKAQWPKGRRDRQYQSLEGLPGIRDMEYRFKLMQLPDSFEGKTVLDLGCSIGAMCFEACRRGAKAVVGLDKDRETIELAQRYAAERGFSVLFVPYDLNQGAKFIEGSGIHFDYMFALSIWEHVKSARLCETINMCFETCWFEGHRNKPSARYKRKLAKYLRPHTIVDLETSEDRGRRAHFKICF